MPTSNLNAILNSVSNPPGSGYLDTMPVTNIPVPRAKRGYSVYPDRLNACGLLHRARLLTLADKTGFPATHRRHLHRPAGTVEIIFRSQARLSGRSGIRVAVSVSTHNDGKLTDADVAYGAVGDQQHRPGRIERAITPAERTLQQQMQQLENGMGGDRH